MSDEIKLRVLYQHKSNKVFYMIGTAENEAKQTVAIISSLDSGKVFTRPVELFIGEEAHFKLVMPQKG